MCTILIRLTIVVFVSQIGALIRMNRTLPCMNAQGINLFAAGIHLKQKLKINKLQIGQSFYCRAEQPKHAVHYSTPAPSYCSRAPYRMDHVAPSKNRSAAACLPLRGPTRRLSFHQTKQLD